MRELPLVFSIDVLRRRGFSAGQIRNRLDTKAWIRLRRSAFCTHETYQRAQDDAHLWHLLQVAAATCVVDVPTWASHTSARRLYHLPDLRRDCSDVTLTVLPVAGCTRQHDGIRLLPATVPSHHASLHRGVPLLSAARTVVDTARSYGLGEALIIGDAALHHGMTSAAELRNTLRDCAGWPGVVAARRAVGLMDGRRESPLESRSFEFFVDYDLPLPEPQVEIFHQDGAFIGRVDFLWRQFRVIGEADGRVKYVNSSDNDDRPRDALWRERRRHDDLDDAGYGIVRWTVEDIRRRPRETRERILRCFARTRQRFDL